MAGIDEANARTVLAVMQERLARDPASALGVAANATADDVRARFLELTKQYHPVRFGRMSLEIQKLSNEVFLALRAAHDSVTKTLKRQTGPMAIPRAAQAVTASPSGPGPLPHPPQPGPQGTAVRPRPIGGFADSSGVRAPIGQIAQAGSGAVHAGAPATAARIAARAAGPASAPATQPISTVQPSPRAGIAAAGAARPVTAPQVTPRDESVVLDLLSRQQWDQARTALSQLSSRDPSSKRIRALISYARGREAQIDGRVDDARVELHDALDLDPELTAAKTALTELFTRRK